MRPIGRTIINLNGLTPPLTPLLAQLGVLLFMQFWAPFSMGLDRQLTKEEVTRLESNLKSDPKNTASRRFLFEHYYREKQWAKAAAAGQPIQSELTQKEMMSLLYALNESEDGQGLMSSLGYYQSKFQPSGTSKLYEGMARVYLARKESLLSRKQDRAMEAIASFKESIKLDPMTKDAYFAWLAVLKEFWSSYHEDAIAIYRMMETAQKNYKLFAAEKCELYLAARSWNEAINVCGVSMDTYPDKLESYANLAEALIVKSDIEKAKAVLTKALARDKNSFPANRTLGNLYFTEKNFVSASEAYMKALKSKPDDARVYLALALSEFQQRNHEVALKHFHSNCWLVKKVSSEFVNAAGQLRDNLPMHNRYKAVMSSCQEIKP